MENLKIYVRTKLKTSSGKRVPNGKMAAQSAHAVMGVFLSLFKKEEDSLILIKENKPLFNAFKNKTLNITFEEYKEEIPSSKNVIEIIDQGRTVFKEPTLTAVAVAPEDYIYNKFIDCDSEKGERYGAKQAIVINKELIKDKWEMFSLVSEASMGFLLDTAIEFGDEIIIPLTHEGVKAWIEGAFAKITLQPNNSELLEVDMIQLMLNVETKSNLLNTIIEKDDIPVCISIGPDFVWAVDTLTKDGFKLA